MTKPFLEFSSQIKRTGKPGKIIFCLDFDGTLTPLRRHPSDVRASSALICFLKKASRLSGFKVAVISGRSLAGLREKIPVSNLIFAGSHGLEFFWGKRSFKTNPSLQAMRKLSAAKKEWRMFFKGVRGIAFENKPFSFVLHYRRARPETQERANSFVASQKFGLMEKGLFVLEARKAFEVFAGAPGNKGDVVRFLTKEFPAHRAFIAGDDVTDKNMFRCARKKDWTVSVGRKDLGADYFAKGPGELIKGLMKIIST